MPVFKCPPNKTARTKLATDNNSFTQVEKVTATTNAVVQMERVKLEVNGTAEDNIGVYKSFYAPNDASTAESIEIGRMEVIATDVSDGSEDGSIVFKVMSGGALATGLTITGAGASLSGVGSIELTNTSADITMQDDDDDALEFKDVAGNTYLTIDTTTGAGRALFSQDVEIIDSKKLKFGTGDDITIAWDGTNLDILQAAANSAVLWGIDGAGIDQTWYGDTAGSKMVWDQSADSLILTDDTPIKLGDASDVSIAWDGTNLAIVPVAADTGAVILGADDAGMDMIFYGATASVNATWDQSADSMIFNDSANLVFGTGSDVTIRWDATDLDILAAADDSVIKFGNGTNSFDVWIYGNTANDNVIFDASGNLLSLDGVDLHLEDSDILIFGDGSDVQMRWDGTDFDILAAADDSVFKFGNGTNDFDIVWNTGANNVTFDASASDVIFSDNVSLMFGTGSDIEIRWDGTDLDILQATANSSIKWGVDGAGIDQVFYGDTASTNVTWDQSADSLIFTDNAKAVFGTGSDVTVRWDATDLDILAAADDSVIKVGNGTNSFDVWVYGETASDYLVFDASANSFTVAGDASIRAKKVLTDPGDAGAIPITTSGTCALTSAGAETRTLADPTYQGQVIDIFVDTYAGDITLTAASAVNVANNNTLVFGAVSEFVSLTAVTVGAALVWQIVGNDGVALSTV